MRHVIICIISCFLFAGCVSTGSTQFINKQDKFSGQDTSAVAIPLNPGMVLVVSASRESGDVRECTPDDQTVGFMYNSSYSDGQWRYLKTTHARVIADGERIGPVEVAHDGDVHTGFGSAYTTEIVALLLTDADYKRIVNAKSLEFQIGLDEFSLDSDQINDLNRFATSICNSGSSARPLSAHGLDMRSIMTGQ